MQTYKRNLILTLAFLVAGGLHAASITGRISDLTGIPVTSSTFVRFELKNCASNIPRVLGQSMIVPNVKDVVPNAQGMITGQVIGNDAITCDVLGNTFYHVTVWNGKTKQFDQNYYVSGATWDITTAQLLSGDPTAVLTFTSYARGDLMIASGVNQMSVLHGNVQSTRRFLGMSGDGTTPLGWDWYPLQIGDLPDNIPASKITGLEAVLQNSGMTQLPALSGDLNSVDGSTAPAVVGIRGKGVASASPANGQVLQYVAATGLWTPSTPAPGGVTGFKGRAGAVSPAANDYDFSMISGTIGIAQLPNSIPASKIDGGLVTDAQFGYLNGVTSPLQPQIDNKSALIHTHNFNSLTGTIGDSQINAGISAVKIGTGSVDNAHLAYLAGVTSDVQAQLNTKMTQAVDLDGSGHVIRLQNRAVSALSPTNGQGLVWDGAQWAPANIDASAVTLNGDVTGPATAAVVSKVRGVTVSAATPTAGQVLAYSGGQWTPQAVSITARQVSDFAPSADARISAQRGVVNGLASLGADGKLASNQIPATVMNNSFVVASQAAQLALATATGDVVIRTDLTKSYVRNSGVTGTMTDYNELLNPTSPVQSVNGQTGNISLVTSNISEGTNLYYTSARVTAANVGGDITGTVGTASVIKLQGKALSAGSPATGQVLKFDGTQWAPAADAGAAGADALSIKGQTVAGTTPSSGQVLQFNGTLWAPATYVPTVGGDLTGNTGAAIVAQIQGRPVSGTAPGVGQILKWNGTQWAPDIDIGSSGADATSIRGVSVSATAAVSGQILQYNGSMWAPVNFVTDPTMGGDVAQTASTSKVVKIQGRTLATTNPTNGQLLGWNNASAQWEPTTVTIPATASSIQGVAVSATTPTTSQVLQYNGTQWAAASLVTDPAVSGDLTGTASAAKVVKLQARTLSAASPANGQYIGWNGTSSQWEPTSLPSTSNASQLQSTALAVTTPISGQFLQFNGTQWAPATVATTNSLFIQSQPVSATVPVAGQVLQFNGGLWTPATAAVIPTTLSAFTNDSGFLTGSSSLAWAKVAGAPAFLTVVPAQTWSSLVGTVPAVSTFLNDSGYLTAASSLPWARVTGAPVFLTSVPAQAWSTITGKPTAVSAFTNDSGYITISSVPTKVSQLANDSAFLTAVPAQSWASVTGKPTAISAWTNDVGFITSAGIPTAVSTFTNDSGYLTSASSLAWAKVTGAPAFLTSVPAQTWASITGKPTAISTWTNDVGYITSVPAQSWASITGKPTTVSSFTNDAGYLTAATSLPSGTTNQVMTYNGSAWAGKDDARQFSYVVQDTANDLTTTTGSVADLVDNLSPGAWTVLSVFCKSDSGSPTFNLSVNGTNLFSSAQTCTTTGATFTTFSSASFASATTMSQSLVAAATGNKRMSVTVRYKQ